MEPNSYLGTIQEFYQTKKFCDLKLVAVPDDLGTCPEAAFTSPVLCHSLVLISAIPELRLCIPTNQEYDEDCITIFVYNSSNSEIHGAITEIYSALADSEKQLSGRDDDYYASCHRRWVEALGLRTDKKLLLKCKKLPESCEHDSSSTINDLSQEQTKRVVFPTKNKIVESTKNLIQDSDTNEVIQEKEYHENNEQHHFDHQNLKKQHNLPNDISTSDKENDIRSAPNLNNSTKNSSVLSRCSNNDNEIESPSIPVSKDIKQNDAFNDSYQSKITNAVAPVKNLKKEYKERTCIDCNKTFPFNTKGQKSNYQEHISSHFKCDCNIAFGDRKAFKLHMKNIHKGKSGKIIRKIDEDGVTKIKIKKDKPTFR